MAGAEAIAASGATAVPAESSSRASFLRNRRLYKVVGALVLALATLFGVWWVRFRPFVSTDDARVAAPVVTIVTQGAAGRVERVLVREGDVVQAGASLVELDATAERAQVERATALVAIAEARVGEAEVQVRLEERMAKASEARANAGVRSAKAAAERRDGLAGGIYDYLTGPQFQARVEGIAECMGKEWRALQQERAAVERRWSEREEALRGQLRHLAGMVGDLQGAGA